MALFGAGAVLKGLSGTREGYHLDYAINHIFFEMADALRGPIRFITNELEGLARVIRAVSRSGEGAETNIVGTLTSPRRAADKSIAIDQENLRTREAEQQSYASSFSLAEKGVREKNQPMEDLGVKQLTRGRDQANADYQRELRGLTRGRSPDGEEALKDAARSKDQYARGLEHIGVLRDQLKGQPAQKMPGPLQRPEAAPGMKPSKADEHLQPIMHVSFGDVAGLQGKLQALASENPAQERGLSLVENCYNMLVRIYNKLSVGDSMTEIPDPSVKNGVKNDR